MSQGSNQETGAQGTALDARQRGAESQRDSGLPPSEGGACSRSRSHLSGQGAAKADEVANEVVARMSDMMETFNRRFTTNLDAHMRTCHVQFEAHSALIRALQDRLMESVGGQTTAGQGRVGPPRVRPRDDVVLGGQPNAMAESLNSEGFASFIDRLQFSQSHGRGDNEPPQPIPRPMPATPSQNTVVINAGFEQSLVRALAQTSLHNQMQLPTFPGSEHPITFLHRLDDYFEAFPHLSFRDQMRLVDQALKSDAALWFRSRRFSYRSYPEFRVDFENEFWSTQIQSELIGELYSGRYRNGSMETYARQWQCDVAFLRYPIPEPVVVDILIRHFEYRVQQDLMMFEVKSFSTLFAKLRVLDKAARPVRYDSGNWRSEGNANRGFLSRNGPTNLGFSDYSAMNRNRPMGQNPSRDGAPDRHQDQGNRPSVPQQAPWRRSGDPRNTTAANAQPAHAAIPVNALTLSGTESGAHLPGSSNERQGDDAEGQHTSRITPLN
ncbi:Reverse transcriptase (RNA-dependent DNA polymerase) [Nesidiocoris tenuis]|uniref:Reverse transcriptase (RNA-dependent DNA polymerase) n=1 Tax=Nesidiocoris tenuis TaxID=355587 RepID=A0ABN7AB35_9HEMI|nr:Reverse transcriptase (RNA-dependent DNA polymerase) [Nesidiocoris tenuis]